jgi:GDP-D-mannose dehydratase
LRRPDVAPTFIHYPLLDAEINCLGNLKLLEAVRSAQREAMVVYTSSSTVIGRACTRLWTKTMGAAFGIYSANKGVAEK